MNTREYFADVEGIDGDCIKWARSHDWFVCGSTEGKGSITGLCNATGETFVFTNMTDLLDWSGY